MCKTIVIFKCGAKREKENENWDLMIDSGKIKIYI